MPQLARLGDAISHGGAIIEGSGDVHCNGIPVARIGDAAICVIHGAVTIVSGSATVRANGRGVARIGDATSCGATIVSGSADTRAGG